MTVTLKKERYYFLNVSQLHLRYASCRAIENSTHFVISTPLDDCGTLVNETEDGITYRNEVQADALIIDNVITRTHDVKLPFSCRYSRKTLQSLGFTPQSIFFGHEGNGGISFFKQIFFGFVFSYVFSYNISVSSKFWYVSLSHQWRFL